MTASDRERARIEKLASLLRENHVTPQDARREELAKRPIWKKARKDSEVAQNPEEPCD
jgi:hypothetical protein